MSFVKTTGCVASFLMLVAGGTARPPASSAPPIDGLIKILADPDKSAATKATAIRDLAALGADAKSAIPAVKPFLGSAVRELQAAAIVFYGKAGKESIPDLIQALENDPKVYTAKRDMMLALGNYGSDAAGAIPLLVKIAKQPPEKSMAAALEAMGKIRTPADTIAATCVEVIHTQLLVIRVNYSRSHVRAALAALERLGPDAKAAVPGLKALLQSFVEKRRASESWPGEFLKVLQSIGPNASDAAPAVRLYLNSREHGRSAEKALEVLKK